jgi:type I restriction enzyme S subunit
MIDGLKPYPEYKGSGQVWVGNIPEHWDILPNRAIFEEVKERGHPDEEMLSVTIKRGVILQKTLLSDSSKKDSSNQNKLAYKLVCPNDIAYNKMRAWQGAIGASNFRGIVSPAYVIMRLRGTNDPRYFHYLFRTPHFAKEAERWSYGITSDMWSLRPEHFKMIYTPIPPTDEQAVIVKFLDHAILRLNRAIRAKQKIIALLNEQKQVIIHRAVTCGLDPDVPLKASGIPWLGDIPKHWNLKRFKFVGRINSGQVDPRLSQYRDLLLIAPNHIESGTGKILFERTANEQGADSGKYLANRGQVLYSKIRPNLRKVAIAPRNCLCSADMYPISPKKDLILADYMVLLMLSQPFTKYVVDCSMRVAMPKVNREALDNCWLWFPQSLDEQAVILDDVKRENEPVDSAISFIQHQISLLQEYRSRLIVDVVTGKVDVREAARHLPDETDEVEPDMGAIDAIEEELQESETMGEAYG